MRIFPDFEGSLVSLKALYEVPEYDVASIHRTNKGDFVLFPIERSIQRALNKK
jgi:hypothetical protein